MRKISKILVCLDFSDYSHETLEYAVMLAPPSATIAIINVINNRGISALRSVSAYFPDPDVVELYVEKNIALRQKNIQKMLDEQFKDYADRFNSVIRVGVPFEEILHVVEKEKLDLVVMGAKGRSDLSRTLFGSQAEKVFRHSPVPVISVRNREASSLRKAE